MRSLEELTATVQAADRIWLFLDYDGTLAEFSPTPDDIQPQPEVIEILSGLITLTKIRMAVISGRRLKHVEALLPVPGLLLAGTYGIELKSEDGERIERIPFQAIRPSLESLKPKWEGLLSADGGFYLEDKGWALAIHARDADDATASEVIAEAREIASAVINTEVFRILGGHKFLEVAPVEANKGRTLEYLLQRSDWDDALMIYIGDDDKDEEAFEVLRSRGGVPIVVSSQPRESKALYRLESPRQTRAWLASLLEQVKE